MNFDTATNTDMHQSEIEHADQMQQQANKNSYSSVEHDIARELHGMKDFGVDTFSKLKFAAQTLWHHPVDFTENLLSNASQFLTDPENEIAYMLSGGKIGDPASIARSEIRGESVLNYFSALANSQFGTAQQGYLLAQGLSWLIPVGAAKILGVAGNAAGMFGRGVDETQMVYHTVTSATNAQRVLDGIDPLRLNLNSRFGQAFYLSERPETTLAELTYHNAIGVDTIRYNFNKSAATILDFTNSEIAQKWGYTGGRITEFTQNIGLRARDTGYNVIRFPSERGLGANLAVFSDFESLLKPQMIVPSPKFDPAFLNENTWVSPTLGGR